MEILQEHIENNKNLVEIVRFMIKDNMFDKEFILTAILEYLENNIEKKSEKNLVCRGGQTIKECIGVVGKELLNKK